MWVTLLLGIAKAIPAARDIMFQAIDLYYAEEQRADESEVNKVHEERDAIAAALKQPGMTDDNRRVLRTRLIALSRL